MKGEYYKIENEYILKRVCFNWKTHPINGIDANNTPTQLEYRGVTFSFEKDGVMDILTPIGSSRMRYNDKTSKQLFDFIVGFTGSVHNRKVWNFKIIKDGEK